MVTGQYIVLLRKLDIFWICHFLLHGRSSLVWEHAQFVLFEEKSPAISMFAPQLMNYQCPM